MEAATWEPSENIEAGLLRFAILIYNNYLFHIAMHAIPYIVQ